jgi:hypothetical protein
MPVPSVGVDFPLNFPLIIQPFLEVRADFDFDEHGATRAVWHQWRQLRIWRSLRINVADRASDGISRREHLIVWNVH